MSTPSTPKIRIDGVNFRDFRVSTTEEGYAMIDGVAYQLSRFVKNDGTWHGWYISKRGGRGYSVLRKHPFGGFATIDEAVEFARAKSSHLPPAERGEDDHG